MTLRPLVTAGLAAAGIGLVPAGPAVAADLKAPPLKLAAEAMRACPEYGPGFIRLPGLDVCLKSTIDVTYEMKLDLAKKDIYIETTRVAGNPLAFYEATPISRTIHRFSSRIDPRFNLMTVSKVGDTPVLTFSSFRSSADITAADSRSTPAPSSDGVRLDQAWIKFAGLTAGRHTSLFDFTPGYTYTGGYASSKTLNLLAYTHTFGTLGSISLSAEDATERKVQDGVWANYSGQSLPDLVGQARITPSWGIVHASGALREIRDGIAGRTGFGYALSSGIEVRRKWSDVFGASAGETYGRLLVSGTYANGAIGYLGIPKFGTDYVSDITGRIERTKGHSFVASYEHVWAANFKTTATLSAYRIGADMLNYTHAVRGMVAQVGAEYMPVPGLMVGVEGDYFRDSVRGTYFAVPATRDRVNIVTAFAYVRRRF